MVTTGTNGQATSSVFSANTTTGNYNVTANRPRPPPPRGPLQRDEHRRRARKGRHHADPGLGRPDSATTNVKLGYQLEDAFNNPTTNTTGATISLTVGSSSAKGFFAGANNPPAGTLGATTTVTFAANAGTATDYYGDEGVGGPTITAKNGAATWGADHGDDHRRPAPPGLVAIMPNPTSAGASGTTNVTLGYQLLDPQFANPTTNTTGATISLTVGSSSAKGFFAGANNTAPGTLGATPTTVTFAANVGTATDYYGDEPAWVVRPSRPRTGRPPGARPR